MQKRVDVQTCIAGRNFPVRHLLREIMESRGHTVSEVANPAECFYQRPGQHANNACKLVVAQYTGSETVDMIDLSIERSHTPPENFLVLANGSDGKLKEVQELGCRILRQPLRTAEFVEWVVASERRCEGRSRK